MTEDERIIYSVRKFLEEKHAEAIESEIKRIKYALSKGREIMKKSMVSFDNDFTIVLKGHIKNIVVKTGVTGRPIFALQNCCDGKTFDYKYDDERVWCDWYCLERGMDID